MPSDPTNTTEELVLLVSEFTDTPGARYRSDGPFSGEEFRDVWLEPKFRRALELDAVLVVDLDGAYGYATSFLEEAFGGLAEKFGAAIVRAHLEIKIDDEEDLRTEIFGYIDRGTARKKSA